MTQHAAPTPSPTQAPTSRRARRERERALAARHAARGPRRHAGVLALRRQVVAHPNLSAGLVGALAVVLPAAGLTLTDTAPAQAAVSRAGESVVDVLDSADAAGDVNAAGDVGAAGDVDAGSRTPDDAAPAGLGAAQETGAISPVDPAQCAPAEAAMPMAEGSYEITSPFGTRVHPIFGDVRQHDGTDFAAPAGTPISTVAAGTVLHSGANIGQPGTLVVIEHELDGQVWTSWYLHIHEQDIAVSEGQQVEAGQLVGLVGSAGNSTGPHLHLEIHEGPGTGGPAVDPQPWLAQHAASAATC